jgi:hypothetical protein
MQEWRLTEPFKNKSLNVNLLKYKHTVALVDPVRSGGDGCGGVGEVIEGMYVRRIRGRRRDYIDRATRRIRTTGYLDGQLAKFGCYHCCEISGERNSNAIELYPSVFDPSTVVSNVLTQPKWSPYVFCSVTTCTHALVHTYIICTSIHIYFKIA